MNINKIKKEKYIVFLNVCCVMGFYVFLCRTVCCFLFGPCCHDALKLDISTLFTKFFEHLFKLIIF